VRLPDNKFQVGFSRFQVADLCNYRIYNALVRVTSTLHGILSLVAAAPHTRDGNRRSERTMSTVLGSEKD